MNRQVCDKETERTENHDKRWKIATSCSLWMNDKPLYQTFLLELKTVSLTSGISHSTFFTKPAFCNSRWCSQRTKLNKTDHHILRSCRQCCCCYSPDQGSNSFCGPTNAPSAAAVKWAAAVWWFTANVYERSRRTLGNASEMLWS